MNSYTIMYIDEDEAEINTFKRQFRSVFNVESIDLNELDLDALLERLSAKQFDYLIVDFQLNEMSGCGFDGDDVLGKFLESFPHFPSMLLTNFDEGAMEQVEGFDVEKVRSKKEYLTPELKTSFSTRIVNKIEQYRSRIESAEEKLQQLANKRATDSGLNADEEDELIKLDRFLEETIDASERHVPEGAISSSNEAKLDNLLQKTDELIEKLRQNESISG